MSRPAAQPIACEHGIPFRDRCAACEEHYDADRKRLAAIEQREIEREIERKEATRAVSADWTCDRCGEQTWFYEPGPRSTVHHGAAALSNICGGTWRRS